MPAPALVPASTSIGTPRSASLSSTPMCAKPRAPPQPRATPTLVRVKVRASAASCVPDTTVAPEARDASRWSSPRVGRAGASVTTSVVALGATGVHPMPSAPLAAVASSIAAVVVTPRIAVSGPSWGTASSQVSARTHAST